MRIYLSLSPNTSSIPFNYQPLLTGCLHKWIGLENKEHDRTSLYSFSWLQNVKTSKSGIDLKPNSTCFFSFHDDQLAKKVISGIMDDPALFCGVEVRGVDMRLTPEFSAEERFIASSPILIKRADENHKEKHFAFEETESNALMTQTLQTKLATAGLATENVSVKFDDNYSRAKTKLVAYNQIKSKANVCPVIIKGSPEQVAFAWNVGVGNSTGIGFGSLK